VRKELKELTTGGNDMLQMALDNWPGPDGKVDTTDDKWMLMKGEGLPGTLTPEVYRVFVEKGKNEGGARMVMSYENGDEEAKRPDNLEWIQVVKTDKPWVDAGAQPNVAYIDGQQKKPNDVKTPFYWDQAKVRQYKKYAMDISPDIDYLLRDGAGRACLTKGPDGKTVGMHVDWVAETWLVTWDGKTPSESEKGTLEVHDGFTWGFDLWPKEEKPLKSDVKGPSSGSDGSFDAPAINWDGQQTLSFDNLKLQKLMRSDGTLSNDDPLANATVMLGPSLLTEFADAPTVGDISSEIVPGVGGTMIPFDYWSFDDTTLAVYAGGLDPVMTADVVNMKLRPGAAEDSESNSVVQGALANVVIDESLGSAYLQELQNWIDSGRETHLSLFSDLLDSQGLLGFGDDAARTARGQIWLDGTVPEPSTILISCLAFAALASPIRGRLSSYPAF